MPSAIDTTMHLSSRGVPTEQPLLACIWVRDTAEPSVNGGPHFVSCGGKGAAANATLHMYQGRDGMWQIAPEVGARLAYAVARSPARHPNTVRAGEWLLPKPPDGEWLPVPDFHLRHEGPNTEEQPFTLDDLGVDFFLRVKTTKLVWFVDPASGETVHSGAKGAGSKGKPGKRYCPMCQQCFSANDFVSQHLKNLHTPPPPHAPTVASDGSGGARLTWRLDTCPPGAVPCGYQIECTIDGGSTWEILIDDTGSSETRARVNYLEPTKKYRFRVAAHSTAVLGPVGAESADFTPSAEVARASPLALSEPGKSAAAAAQAADLTSPGGQLPIQDLVDTLSPPTSPPPFPNQTGIINGLGNGHGQAGGKRARDDDPAPSASDLLSENSEDLLWSLEELVACSATSPENSAAGSAASKRVRHAEDQPITTADATVATIMDASVAPRLAAPDLARNPSLGLGPTEPELFLQSLLSSFSEEPQLPNYRSAEPYVQPVPAAISIAYSRPSPKGSPPRPAGASKTNKFPPPAPAPVAAPVAPAAPPPASGGNGKGGDGDVARLLRLRSALEKTAPKAIQKRLSSEMLAQVGAAGHARELKLLLTYAAPTAVDAAAAKERLVRDAREALSCNPGELTCAVPPSPRSSSSVVLVDASKSLSRRRREAAEPSRLTAVFAFVLAACIAVTFGGAPAAAFASLVGVFSPPAPVATCQWSWNRLGCVASNGQDKYCRSRPLNLGNVCEVA